MNQSIKFKNEISRKNKMIERKTNKLEMFTLVEYYPNSETKYHKNIEGFENVTKLAGGINESLAIVDAPNALFEVYDENKKIVYSDGERKGKFKNEISYKDCIKNKSYITKNYLN